MRESWWKDATNNSTAPALSVESSRGTPYSSLRLQVERTARTQLCGRLARLLRSEGDALPQIDRGRAVIQSDENNFHLRNARPTLLIPCSYPCSEVPVKMRKIPVHDAVTENHKHEIEDAKRRSARPAPRRCPRQNRVAHINQENQDGDDHFWIAIPIPSLQPVRPDQARRHAGGERNAANQHAAARHALENIERRKPPSHYTQLVVAQSPILHQENNAK